MATHEIRRAVGTFADRVQAEQALTQLRESGFEMRDVSIVSKRDQDGDKLAGVDIHNEIGNKGGEGASKGAATGGILGGLTGLLVGIGAIAIPGIGPVMTAGAVGTAVATTAAGGAIGAVAGGLVGGLIGLGIPEERAEEYHTAVQSGSYLVLVDGSAEEITQAETILHSHGIENYGNYPAASPVTNGTIPTTSTAGTLGMDVTGKTHVGDAQEGK